MAGISTSVQIIDMMSAPLNHINNALYSTIGAFENLDAVTNSGIDTSALDRARNELDMMNEELNSMVMNLNGNTNAQANFNQEVQNGASNVDGLTKKVLGVVAAYATLQTAGKVLDLSDTMSQTEARLNLIVDDGGSVDDLQNKIFVMAENTRASFTDTADMVAKLGLQASKAFSSNDELLSFAEQLNKTFVNVGTAQEGISSVMLQLTQSMASGKLQGEELNAVMDNASPIIANIQKYLQEVQGFSPQATDNIKQLASDGVITAEVIKNAMFYAADETNAKFESMPMTFGQVMTSIQNNALMAFKPVLDRLSEVANSADFQNMTNGVINSLVMVSGIVIEIFDLVAQVAGFVSDNWSILEPIVLGVAAAMGIYAGYLMVTNTLEAISNITKGIAAVRAYAAAAANTALAASERAEAMAKASATAAQYGFNTALLACPITWIIIAIIAVIAAIYAIVAAINKLTGSTISATGIIAGTFAVLGAHIINSFVVPTWNAFAAIANFIGNLFNDPVAAVKVLFYDMAQTVIGYILNMARAIENVINKIPGVTIDITSGLDSFYNSIEDASKKVKDESGWVEYVGRMDYIDYGDAANAGYDFGQGVEDKIGKLFSIDGMNIPNPDDYANDYANSGAASVPANVGDISDNTKGIKDAVDISSEDLKYMRDLAEMEVVNRFTTAEIKIDQNIQFGDVHETADIDGITEHLNEGMREAIAISTEGTHD